MVKVAFGHLEHSCHNCSISSGSVQDLPPCLASRQSSLLYQSFLLVLGDQIPIMLAELDATPEPSTETVESNTHKDVAVSKSKSKKGILGSFGSKYGNNNFVKCAPPKPSKQKSTFSAGFKLI